jgi:molybdate transport system substrate-binding protein
MPNAVPRRRWLVLFGALAWSAAALAAGGAAAAEIHVMSSGGFTAAYRDLIPDSSGGPATS